MSKYLTRSTYRSGYLDEGKVLKAILANVDELGNKPRRFFTVLRDVVAVEVDAERIHPEVLEYANMWLSAVENGLYGEVERLAETIKPNSPQ